MVAKDPAQRVLIARAAAHASWANTTDPAARTAPARAVAATRWERLVDPDRVLTPDQRSRMAEHAQKAHMLQLALKSAQARRARKTQNT